jgi:hypothetical protein
LVATLASRLNGGVLGEGVGYYVRVDRPREFKDATGAFRVIDLDADDALPLTNHLFIVGDNANGGYAIPVNDQTACLNLIAALGLGAAPLATFHPGNGLLRLYSDGVDQDDNQITTIVAPPRPNFTLAELIDVVSLIHERGFSTPQLTNPAFWEDAAAWQPCQLAEKNIQWPLKVALATAFRPHVTVEEEFQNTVGDADFAFYSATAPRNSPPLAVVETKVQKSFRSSGDEVPPSEVAREYCRGLIQTAAYRKASTAGWSALFCFDLRKPGQGGEAAWANAHTKGQRVIDGLSRSGRGGAPPVVTWLVFANTEDAQAAQAVGPLLTHDPIYPVTRRPNYRQEVGAAA